MSSAVVEVGGVGNQGLCAPGTLANLRTGQRATLPTSMVVREDSLTLFGFADDDEKQTFELLQTASGVGPKLAQAMLAVLSPDDLRRAIGADDVKTLARAPDIGNKGGQRNILELKDRFGGPPSFVGAGRTPSTPAADAWRDQVHQGLVGLGWPARDAAAAVDAVAGEAGESPAVPTILPAALPTLSKA